MISTGLEDIISVLGSEADPDARMAMRDGYGIHSDDMLGVPMRRLLQIAKPLGPDHRLAQALWGHGSYEARTIAALVDDADQVGPDQMQRWCDDFDNWAIVDTACFRLFDRTAHAWTMVDRWIADDRLFVRRASFALLWALALHDRDSADGLFLRAMRHVEATATDPRPLVGKAVTMALRAVATKRPTLRPDVLTVAQRLIDHDDPAARRVGRPIMKAFAEEAST